jgi:hypothetical protein
MINLKWHQLPPDNADAVDAAVRKDLASPLYRDSRYYRDLYDTPSALITHTVFLGESFDEGPVVYVWGEKGDDTQFHCRWEPCCEWVAVDAIRAV